MNATIHQGSVFDVLPTINRGSVDCAVTSPPYWMLRSYLKKDHPLKPQELGSEATAAEFVANQVRVFRLVRECLADHGTCWINIGDTYTHDNRGGKTGGKHVHWHGNAAPSESRTRKVGELPEGSLCLIPQRLALALQADGWTVRSVIVWHKPAPMPASLSGWAWRRCRVKVKPGKVNRRGNEAPPNWDLIGPSDRSRENGLAEWTDCSGCKKCELHGGYVLRRGSWRPTNSWEPILMLAKSAGYYCDGEAVKQPSAAATISRNQYSRIIDDPDEQYAVRHDHETVADGANLRDVWTIASEPLREAHYAAFPSELVYRCLRAGTSARGYCPACGSPWARVVEDKNSPRGDYTDGDRGNGKHQTGGLRGDDFRENWKPPETIGWRPSCSCPETEPRPGLVLDPFTGSGRTGLECQRLGLDFVGAELNPEYAEMARRLLKQSMPLFS